MYFSYVVALAAVFTATEACLHCPHPGNFVGFGKWTLIIESFERGLIDLFRHAVTTYIHPNPNYCQTDVNDTAIVVSVPASYFDPFEYANLVFSSTPSYWKLILLGSESPCGGTVNITNTCERNSKPPNLRPGDQRGRILYWPGVHPIRHREDCSRDRRRKLHSLCQQWHLAYKTRARCVSTR